MRPWWSLLAAAFLLAPAAAHAGCVWTDLVADEARIAAVVPGAARVYFVADDVIRRGCPNEGAACRGRAYLTPGDVVLTGPTQGAYTCAGFTGAKGASTIDWLPTAALASLPQAVPAAADWTGHWVAPEQEITVASAPGGGVAISGEATWGAGDPERVRRGGVNTGEISGTATPEAGVVAFAMGDDNKTLPFEAGDEFTCRVRLRVRGPYLVVRDNNACGGHNVSFSGFYRRTG